MRVHHLNCGSHCPFGGRLFDGSSKGPFATICTHCLLLETDNRLVLVDTGYGLRDLDRRGTRRLPATWPLLLNIRLREEDTAIRQIEALGFRADDVRDIILTHLDFDHAGGIADFPHATVHVMAAEKKAADQRSGFVARQRYRPSMWHDVRSWRFYQPSGAPWFGFESVRDLDGLPPEILMIPLPGHSLGHVGVAVEARDGWLLNAGDSFMHDAQLDGFRPYCPVGLNLYQEIMSSDRNLRLNNIERLRELRRQHGSSIRIFASHDNIQFAALRQSRAFDDNDRDTNASRRV